LYILWREKIATSSGHQWNLDRGIWTEAAFSGADMAAGLNRRLTRENHPSSVQTRFLKPLTYLENKQSMAPILE
jgi:hypothetical protein